MCGLRIFAAENSWKRSEARSPDAAISAGTICARVTDDAASVDDSGNSLAWSYDAPRRNTGKFFGALEFGGERISIRAGWAAHDAPAKLVASMARGILPGPVIGHRPFDAKEPLIVVDDDKEERRGGVGRRRFSNNSQVRFGHWRCLMMQPAGCGGCRRTFLA